MMSKLLIMEAIGVQNWTYILVGVTFAIYISIAIWSRASSTKEFYVAGGGVSQSDEIRMQPRTPRVAIRGSA